MRTRNHRVEFRLNDEEFARFDALVRKSGLPIATYLRVLVRGLVPQDLPPPDYYEMARQLGAIGNNLNQIARAANMGGHVDAARYDEIYRQIRKEILEIKRAVLLPRKKEGGAWDGGDIVMGNQGLARQGRRVHRKPGKDDDSEALRETGDE